MVHAALFVGPSIPPERVRALFPGAEVLPPVKDGDLDELLACREPPGHVGIVDGQFLQALAISPKEVLRALDLGVHVYGASSLGALRAVECEPFGMRGVGRIFRMYADGEVDADDEVALLFDPETLRPLSEPMVNIRVALAAAAEQHIVSSATAETAAAVAKAMYFPDRTYDRILHAIFGEVDAREREDLGKFLRSRAPDQKRADALELVEVMKTALGPL